MTIAESVKYKTIVVDPPWPQRMTGAYKRRRHKRAETLPYEPMSLGDIKALPIAPLATEDAHLWLWTTNQFLGHGFAMLKAWGFTYLAPVHAIKPSGLGNYFVHRSQTILFAYKTQCRFPLKRYAPNIIHVGNPKRHSEKWDITYEYIESISPGPRLELFARKKREGWDVWGDEVESDIEFL